MASRAGIVIATRKPYSLAVALPFYSVSHSEVKMEIVWKGLNEITPYANNPRNNSVSIDRVAASIREFGFKVPIVIDASGTIAAGHTRYEAAKRLNWEKVPCIIADDLTPEQIKGFRLADNKVGEASEWDFEKLGEELDGIFDIDMEQFGFDLEVEEEEPEPEEDPFEDIEKLEKHYGVPYQGNKSRIADIIISLLPEGKRLVDLFGGVA
jgi:hypothetical protein